MSDKMNNRSAIEVIPLAVERIEKIEFELRVRASRPISFEFDPSGTNLFSIMELKQSYAKRCVDFADSIRSLLRKDKIVPAAVIARSLIETIAMGCLYVDDMIGLVDQGDIVRLNARFSRFFAGFRGGEVEPVHVMDGIRHLQNIDAEYLSHLDSRYGDFAHVLRSLGQSPNQNQEGATFQEMISIMNNYRILSEVSHPNGLGTHLLYPDDENEEDKVDKVRRSFRSASIMSIWHAHYLINALNKGEKIPERYRESFMNS